MAKQISFVSIGKALSFFALIFILKSCKSDNKQDLAEIKIDDATPKINRNIIPKPPMGWNSWNSYGWTVNEAQVRANAEFMAKNLKQLGYEYIVIDQGWFADAAASNFEDFVHETISTTPTYNIDQNGILQPDTIKFPSSRGGKGFKPLADYIHSLGLKFGVHELRGMPWSATKNNRTIKGTDILCSTIAQPTKGCDWYDGFYGVDMSKPGGQAYYNSVFKTYADWGVDYVKIDDVVNVPELEGISKGIRNTSRDIVISVVPDNDIISMEKLKENAHVARTGFDFWDVWEMLKKGFPVANRVIKSQEPGFYPDLDMLPMGKIGIGLSYKGPNARISNFNKNELHTLLTLWYISKMPLMMGGDLPQSDKQTIELLSNAEALEVNRNSENNRQIKFKNAVIIWAADVPKSEDKYLALFNTWESIKPVNTKVTWKQMGFAGNEYKVRDLWNKKELGSFKDGFSAPVSAHDGHLYKIYK
jgi:alpha-galactosidase